MPPDEFELGGALGELPDDMMGGLDEGSDPYAAAESLGGLGGVPSIPSDMPLRSITQSRTTYDPIGNVITPEMRAATSSAMEAFKQAQERAMELLKPPGRKGPNLAYMAAAAGFGAPTKTGSFFESLGNAMGGYSEAEQKQRLIDRQYAQQAATLGLSSAGKNAQLTLDQQKLALQQALANRRMEIAEYGKTIPYPPEVLAQKKLLASLGASNTLLNMAETGGLKNLTALDETALKDAATQSAAAATAIMQMNKIEDAVVNGGFTGGRLNELKADIAGVVTAFGVPASEVDNFYNLSQSKSIEMAKISMANAIAKATFGGRITQGEFLRELEMATVGIKDPNEVLLAAAKILKNKMEPLVDHSLEMSNAYVKAVQNQKPGGPLSYSPHVAQQEFNRKYPWLVRGADAADRAAAPPKDNRAVMPMPTGGFAVGQVVKFPNGKKHEYKGGDPNTPEAWGPAQ